MHFTEGSSKPVVRILTEVKIASGVSLNHLRVSDLCFFVAVLSRCLIFKPAFLKVSYTIKEVLIPKENEKDLIDMPKKIIDDIKITVVDHADQVLKVALTKELKKTEWVEVDISKKDDKSQASIQ